MLFMNELEWPSELTSFCSQFGKDFSNRELEVIVDLSLREEGVLLTRLVSCSGIRQEKLRSRMLEIYETAINLSKKNRLISFSESVSGRHNKIIGRDLRDYHKNRNEIKHFEKMLGWFNFKKTFFSIALLFLSGIVNLNVFFFIIFFAYYIYLRFSFF